MIKKLDHLVLTTAQLVDCLAFYKTLGFQCREGNGRYELFAGDFKINIHLKGKELTPHATYVQVGSGDLCFEVEGDLDAIKADLLKKGLTIHLGIVERMGVSGPMESLYLIDPDGNLVELCSYVKKGPR